MTIAEYLAGNISGLVAKERKQQCVALLCPSSIDFLFTWLALMRLGHSGAWITPLNLACPESLELRRGRTRPRELYNQFWKSSILRQIR